MLSHQTVTISHSRTSSNNVLVQSAVLQLKANYNREPQMKSYKNLFHFLVKVWFLTWYRWKSATSKSRLIILIKIKLLRKIRWEQRRHVKTPRSDMNLLSELQKADLETLTLLPLCALGQINSLRPLHLSFSSCESWRKYNQCHPLRSRAITDEGDIQRSVSVSVTRIDIPIIVRGEYAVREEFGVWESYRGFKGKSCSFSQHPNEDTYQQIFV